VFEFWKNYRATEPFPGIGFQTTNERRSPDDLPSSEVKQSNPISAYYRSIPVKDKCFKPVIDWPTGLLGEGSRGIYVLEKCA
jgi:hypothetical protein